MMLMFDLSSPVVWLLGVVILGLSVCLVRGHFSPEARVRRRREKSHRPVVSRKQGPAVKLAVEVDKPKGHAKG